MRRSIKQPSSGLHPTVLKPQDVALALKLLALENGGYLQEGQGVWVKPWTLAQLAKETCISLGEVHNALHRLTQTRLLRSEARRVHRHALTEFLLHGVRYAFPAARGEPSRGLPTAYAAPMLKDKFLSSEEIPVWPDPSGEIRGIAFSPLYAAAPAAARQDARFYELLALVDLLRGDGRARERSVAADLLRLHLNHNEGEPMPARGQAPHD